MISEQSKKKKNIKNPNLNLVAKDIKYQIVDETMLELIKRLNEIKVNMPHVRM